jgi:hypothetical protein
MNAMTIEQAKDNRLTKAELAAHQAGLAAEAAAQRYQDQQELAERAKAAGMKRRRVRAANGEVKEVWCFTASYQAMGFDDRQIAAAAQFERDWECAYRGLKAQSFEPGVDGGKTMHNAHVSQVHAQNKLGMCKMALGIRSWNLVVAVVVYGASSRKITELGGKDHRTVKSDMDVAFNDLDAFYTGNRTKDRTWNAVEEFIRERSELIEEAERVV